MNTWEKKPLLAKLESEIRQWLAGEERRERAGETLSPNVGVAARLLGEVDRLRCMLKKVQDDRAAEAEARMVVECERERAVSLPWVLGQLAGMEFHGRGEAYDFIKRSAATAGIDSVLKEAAQAGVEGYVAGLTSPMRVSVGEGKEEEDHSLARELMTNLDEYLDLRELVHEHPSVQGRIHDARDKIVTTLKKFLPRQVLPQAPVEEDTSPSRTRALQETLRRMTDCSLQDSIRALELRDHQLPLAVEYIQRTGLALACSDETRYPLWAAYQRSCAGKK